MKLSMAVLLATLFTFGSAYADATYQNGGTSESIEKIQGTYSVYSVLSDSGYAENRYLGKMEIQSSYDMTPALTFTSDFDLGNYFEKGRPNFPCGYVGAFSLPGLSGLLTCTTPHRETENYLDYTLGFGFKKDGTIDVFSNQRNIFLRLERSF